jgi:hypothetical protein
MSILDAIKETRRESKNLSELALLPQALIMQMGQRKELSPEEVSLIIGKKAELIESSARNAALAQSGQVPPTIMERNMMAIAQAENPAPSLPEDVGIAQNPVPPMQMAGGGIVAFDEGGDVEEEDEYEEMREKAREDELNEQIFDMISESSGNAGVGIMSGRRGGAEGMTDKAERGSNDIDRLRAVIMQRESGGRRYDKEGNLLTSSKGALGEMQVMPATAKDPGFGIKPARDNSPDELRRVGDEYAEILLNRYRDPKLAMIAYNMGPGATDKWLASGADVRKLPKETQGYIRGVSLAEGGEVKRFQAGGTMGGFGDEYTEQYTSDPRFAPFDGEIDEYVIDPMTGQKLFSGYGKRVPKDKSKAKDSKKEIRQSDDAETEKFFSQFQPAPVTQGAPGAQTPAAPKKEDEAFNFIKYLQGREAKMDKAAEMDRNQALLAAGLGILGGTSQYAAENIGKGAQLGVQQLSQLQRMRAGQDASLGKLYGSAAQAEMLNELRRDRMAQDKEIRANQANQKIMLERNDFVEKRLKARGMDETMLNNLRLAKAQGKLDPAKQATLDAYERQIKDIERQADRMYPVSGAGRGVIKLD